MKLAAKWIWKKQLDYTQYNQTIIAKKEFYLGKIKKAVVMITADSSYRLYCNGLWINDGPCRSWPEHYQYDQIDITRYLWKGKNEITVIARYFGTGDFHRVPKQAGLLVQLEANLANGKKKTIISDKTWKVAQADAWIQATPKISVQMEPAEYYNSCFENNYKYTGAQELFAAGEGPWKDLNSRDVALMTQKPVFLKSFIGANIVKSEGLHFCLPASRLCHAGLIEANSNTSMPCGIATIVEVDECVAVRIGTNGLKITVDGKHNKTGLYRLTQGRHLVFALADDLFDHHGKDKTLCFYNHDKIRLVNPFKADHENPWCFFVMDEFLLAQTDLVFVHFIEQDDHIGEVLRRYKKATSELFRKIKDIKVFVRHFEAIARCMPYKEMFVEDDYWMFEQRSVIKDAIAYIENPQALMTDNSDFTTLTPPPDGDLELIYDLGGESCGYFNFELLSGARTIIDLYAVEYITADGKVQHTRGNRNGMRYIAKPGLNTFMSLKRRGARYLFLTVRGMTSPVKIRFFKLVESIYPVNNIAEFQCSDTQLNKIWQISARTLQLCMEDTYTDCPVYEQTLWVGDARNESLYGYTVFGAYDIAARCIKLAAHSLERYPIVGCQVPSSWECLLPAWSFLWGISVWEYYWHTGDIKFLKKTWPSVMRNIGGAEAYLDDNGLLSCSFWNFFDWTNIDQEQPTVLHNTLFFVGAVDAAIKCAEVLSDHSAQKRLNIIRAGLIYSINRVWDKKKKSFPDSIHADGTISKSVSQHTSILAVLYDIVKPARKKACIKNMINPSEKTVLVGSPFATQFLYEALEKMGMYEKIIASIYENFLPIVNSGAACVWESFASGTTAFDGFPTRSHCHAWSSSPLHFLNRIILGIRQSVPGAKEFVISPYISGLSWANGAVASPFGLLQVNWKLCDNLLSIRIEHPRRVKVRFSRNASHKGLRTVVEFISV